MTAPLVPLDTDLRGYDYMPLKVAHLRDSDFATIATDAEFRAGVMLWCAAWHQVPASSLPNDDRLLCRLAGLGRDIAAWMAVCEVALRGFVQCTDGLLYHPVIADLALEAVKKQKRDVERTRLATEARKRRNEANAREQTQRDVQRHDDVTTNSPPNNGNVTSTKGEGEGKGEERDKRKNSRAAASRQPESDQSLLTPVEPPSPKSPDRDRVRVWQLPHPPNSPDRFPEFKSAYPKRKGDLNWSVAEKRFLAALKTGIDAEVLISAARLYAAACEEDGSAGTSFVAMASTWLNECRWKNYPPPTKPALNGILDRRITEPLSAEDIRRLQFHDMATWSDTSNHLEWTDKGVAAGCKMNLPPAPPDYKAPVSI